MAHAKRINKDWVEFDFDQDFSWDKVERLREIPGSKFNSEKKVWRIPLKEKDSTVEFLRFCNAFEVEVTDGVKRRLKELREVFKDAEAKEAENRSLITKKASDLGEIEGLTGTLREYQKIAVEYIAKNKRVIVGDDPGLGKTISAMGAIKHLDAFPVLCVVPAVVRGNWKNEWEKWDPNAEVNVMESGKQTDFGGDVIICTYSLVHNFVKAFKKRGFEAIIVDESHFVKNAKARRSKSVKKIAKKIDVRILLTGTPVVNSPSDLINQLKVLGRFKEDFGGWMGFTGRYCDRKKKFGRWDVSGASNLKELNMKLTGNCYVRRNRGQVLKELPERQISNVPCEVGKKYWKAESDFVSHLQEKFGDLPKRVRMERIQKSLRAEKLVKFNELRRIAALEKTKAAKKWLSLQSEPVVVFTQFRETANALSEAFDCDTIDGTTKNKTQVVEDFQNGNSDVLVVNVQAGGVGITLTRSSTVLFVSIPWTWAEVDQAISRVHRMGQKDRVNAHFLVGEGTVDETLMGILERKKDITEKIIEGGSLDGAEEKEIAEFFEKKVN